MDEAGRIVTDDFFQRVAKRVPEIEQGAIALFGLVAGDDRRLGLAGDGDGVLKFGTMAIFSPTVRCGKRPCP